MKLIFTVKALHNSIWIKKRKGLINANSQCDGPLQFTLFQAPILYLIYVNDISLTQSNITL